MVDSGTASKAEALVSKLREALPHFPAALPRTKLAPHTAMTDWLAAGEAPGGFELDADCELKDGSENGAVVRCSRIDLTSDEIRQHIATGKQATKLGLIWNEKIRFQLTDALQLKRIQFLDVLQEEASQAGDDRESLFAATFLLMSEELGELVSALVEALGGLEDSQALPAAAPAASPAAAADNGVDVFLRLHTSQC
jgi:recombination associated protein RdgC